MGTVETVSSANSSKNEDEQKEEHKFALKKKLYFCFPLDQPNSHLTSHINIETEYFIYSSYNSISRV